MDRRNGARYLARMIWENLLCMGDSITHGARTYLGYPEQAGRFLRESTTSFWNVWNFAWNGYKAIDLARAIDENRASLAHFSPSLCTVMIGTNDAKEGVPPDQFQVAMEQIAVKAKHLTQNGKLLLLHVPHLASGVSLPYTHDMNERITAYNRLIDGIAAHHTCDVLALRITAEDLIDGVHLNDTGVVSCAKQIERYVLRERGLNG